MPLPPPGDPKQKGLVIDGLSNLRHLQGEVTLAPEARVVYVDWFHRHEAELQAAEERETLAGFYTRLETYVLKIAMVLQLSHDRSLVIAPEWMQAAINLVDWLKGNLRQLLAEEFAFSLDMKERKKVIKFIRANPGTRRGPILRYCHLTAQRLDGILRTLLMEESICEVDGAFFPQWPQERGRGFANVRNKNANRK